MTEYMCIVHLKKEAYLVNREAFYLLCRLQEIEFEEDAEKFKMFKITLDWLIDRKKAMVVGRPPTHLVIQFRDE